MKSLKVKWLLPYIVLLSASIFVSVIFGYYMAKQSMIDSLSSSEEKRLDVKIDNFYEKYNNSALKFSTLANNESLRTPFESSNTTGVVQYTENVANQMKPFMFINKEFEAVFLMNETWIIGVSKNDRYISERDDSLSQQLTEDDIKNLLSTVTMTISHLYKENMLITRLSDTSYLVAILDFDEYFNTQEGDIRVLDKEGHIIYSKNDSLDEFAIDKKVYSEYEYNVGNKYITNKHLYTYIKDYKNTIFVSRYPTVQLNAELKEVLRLLILVAMVISAIFILGAVYYVNNLVGPLNRFITMINRRVSVQENNIEDQLTSRLMNNRNLTISLRVFYLTVLIPFVCVNVFMVFTLKDNVAETMVSNQKHMIEEWVRYIDNEIDGYQDILQFLSIDEDIQAIVMNDKGYSSDEVNYTLLEKGAVDSGFFYSEIGSSEGEVLFSNQPLRLKKGNEDWSVTKGNLKDNESIKYVIEVREDNSIVSLNKSVLLIKSDNKEDVFEEIGYIQISMEGFIENSFFIENNFPIDRLTISDRHNDIIYEFDNNIEGETVVVSGEIESLSLAVDYGFLLSTTEFERTLLNYYLFMFVLLSFLLFIVAEVTSYKLIKPLNALIEQMDEISSYEIYPLVFDQHISEFNLLANSFNKMMDRLHDMSENLMKQEVHNNELEQRHMRLLLTSIEAQVSPHFLHNIITSIIFLVKGNQKDDAIHMLLETSEFFKLSLYGTKSLVKLEEEIHHVENYINIQQIRLPNRIHFINSIPENMYDLSTPKFMLQPLIENAIEHGMKSQEKLNIHINAFMDQGYLTVTVEDDGVGIKNEEIEQIITRMDNINNSESHGLANVHQRIKLIYGGASGVKVTNHLKGAKIVLKMLMEDS